MSKKNFIDYVMMGLKSAKTEKNRKIQEEQKKHRDDEFDKAYADKTYSVAQKVLDNVEKVADYDYDALFDRVSKSIEGKVPKPTRSMTEEERQARSREFDQKIKNHTSRFNIEDYISSEKNYKNSIIEKTKKNIAKKYREAEERSQDGPLIKPAKKKVKVSLDLDLGDEKKIRIANTDEPIGQESLNTEILTEESLGDKQVEDKDETLMDQSVSDTVEKTSKELSDQIEHLGEVKDETSGLELSDQDSTINDSIDNSVNITSISQEDLSDENKEDVELADQEDLKVLEVDESSIDLDDHTPNEDSQDDKVPYDSYQPEQAYKSFSPKPVVSQAKNVIKNSVNAVNTAVISGIQAVETSVQAVDQSLDAVLEPVDKEIEPSLKESDAMKVDLQDKSEKAAVSNEDTKLNQTLGHQYSKSELNKHKKHFRTRKKSKFAKKMKVELDDSIIGQQKRTFRRLFKFSLSFKLSFVFMLLIILTVVSLSAAFYLGIDYVLELKDAGKLDDIQFFKDVLIVLLIIFDMVAILLCISFGTKASRELVTPIDEMTNIVKHINAQDMDRRLNVKGMHDELKELALTFNEMLDRIEKSYETQNRFTSDASHELRTPIAVIQGYINMLDRWGKADGEILDESIEAIKSESKNMKRLTEKLLLLAKADKGVLELDFQPFELNELITEITKETQMIDSNHAVGNKINDVKTIYADRESLKQAIRIFVDNAIKYTPDDGSVFINSYINKKKIYIEIEDNGIGISKEDMDNIFNRFYRVDKSRTKESGGHGLGLSIAKWIVSQHKGEIEVKSELNKGTIITLILSPIH